MTEKISIDFLIYLSRCLSFVGTEYLRFSRVLDIVIIRKYHPLKVYFNERKGCGDIYPVFMYPFVCLCIPTTSTEFLVATKY